MVAPQVQPLQNPFDDAAFYFDNHQTLANNYMEQNSDKSHTITSIQIVEIQKNTKALQQNGNRTKPLNNNILNQN
ncbi:unnamed protein product [Parnassius apollo]|uniref:(apollo) hypothetical protein n=1 Tax=Parnassius apollo TaxID=110799 RepID=A0A8S3XL47_PARAO|nr:unnamed protein product [Parnassius apollo]